MVASPAAPVRMAATLHVVVRADGRMATMKRVKLTREMVERIERALDERKPTPAAEAPDGVERRRGGRGAKRKADETPDAVAIKPAAASRH